MNGPTPDDPVVRRAVDELRHMPAVDADAVRRVVLAAAAARVAPADEPAEPIAARTRSVRVWSAIGMAAAAAIVGFVARGLSLSARDAITPPVPAPTTVASAPTPVATTARFVASNASDIVAVPQQFVLENSHAHSISVVGDFNKWNPASARMERSSNGTLWSAIVPVLPGRHMYGFMIDDSIFVLAPGGQTVRDPDLGTEASVLMVRRP